MHTILRLTAAAAALTLYLGRALAAPLDADPNYYSFYPTSIMSIGLGFNPNDLSQAKTRCIASDSTPLETGALHTSFGAILVTNSEQLSNALSLDANVDASYLSFSGGASFSYSERSLFSEDSATVVVLASTEFGRLDLKPPIELTLEAAAFVGDSKKFFDRCGSRFVVIEHRGASVYAIITIFNSSSSDSTDLKTSMQASGGWGPLNGKASASFQKMLSRAAQTGQLSVQVVATGGEGFGALGSTIVSTATQPKSLDLINQSLANFLAQFNAKNSVPIGFNIGSMTRFGWEPNQANIWDEDNERQLRNIGAEYRKSSAILDQAKAIVSNQDPLSTIIDQPTIDRVSSQIDVIDKHMSALAMAFKACKDGKGCKVPQQPFPDNLIPSLPRQPAGTLRVMVDNKVLDEVRSNAIILSPGLLIDKVKVYQPAAKQAQIVLNITGNYIGSVTLGLRYNDHSYDIALLNTDSTNYVLCSSDAEELAGVPCPGIYSGILANDELTRNEFRVPTGTVMTVYVRVVDRLSRSVTIDVLSKKVTVLSPGSSNIELHWLAGLATP